jgi:hypothetical protein
MVTTRSCRKPRKEELKLNFSTWKYSKTPRVLRLTLLTKASPGAEDQERPSGWWMTAP